MEMAFAGMTVSVVTVIAVGFGARVMQMAQTLDAVSVTGGARTDVVLYRAEHGRWPPPGELPPSSHKIEGIYVEGVGLGRGGVITATMTLGSTPHSSADGPGLARDPDGARGFLSFRPELLGSSDTPSVSFLCGDAKPVPGAVDAVAEGQTTLPKNILPPYCR